MLNYFIAYCIPMSFFLCFYHHNRVVVPGMERNALKGIGKFLVRGWIIGFVMLWALRGAGLNPLGDGYVQWWDDYTAEHSAILWVIFIPTITLGLLLVKVATYHVAKGPGTYADPQSQLPCLHKVDMKPALVFNAIYWMWLLANPLLPFWKCWVRGFLRG